eukprot:766507-Hanusia_phi.AAC.3
MLRDADHRIQEAVNESVRLKKQLQEIDQEWHRPPVKVAPDLERSKGRRGLSEQEEELAELERLPQDSEIYR